MAETGGGPTFTVVVVTIGGLPVLERCLRSIAGGDRVPDELVLVDQSLAGRSVPARRWLEGSRVPFRHLVVEPMGVSRARNLGAARARGDFIAFTDDDCVPDPAWLRNFAEVAVRTGADAASSRVLPLTDQATGRLAVSLRTAGEELVYDGSESHTPWDIGTGASMLVRSRSFRSVGGFDEGFGPGARFRAAEDIDLLERLMVAGATVVYAPEPVVYHQLKTRAEWVRRQVPYGYGMGGMIARAAPPRRRFLMRSYGSMLASSAASGLRRASAARVAEALLMGVGFARGFASARRRAP